MKPLHLGEIYLCMLTSSFKQLSHPLVFKKHGDIWGIGIAYLQSQNSFRQKKRKKKKYACVYVCVDVLICAAQGQRRRDLFVRQFSLMNEPQKNEKHV